MSAPLFFTRFAPVCFYSLSISATAQFAPTAHQPVPDGAIPVSQPGSFGKAGAIYMLTNDLSSAQSAVFLGKDVTLDLNGYTIRYADGDYEHIPNSGFEEGDKGWDFSMAPGATVVNTAEVHVFVGKKVLRLKKGDEITSAYVNLPVARRSYFAMCGVTGSDYHAMGGNMDNQMRVSIYVEDENGKDISLTTVYGDTTMVSCPLVNASPQLGGGILYAHLNNLPAGKYRIRVKAETDCLVDEIDIRPGMDTGIGIVGNTRPLGHYYHMYNCGFTPAFFDYTGNISTGEPLPSIPQVKGTGTVTIRNGVIESGAIGFLSWGIQSTAPNVKIILDNVKVKTSGINTAALTISQGTITRCRFEVENPFIINRHCSFGAVNIMGRQPSEISFSEFYGGQGCLYTYGKNSSIHHNTFVNRQMVTNHYSIAPSGSYTKVFENKVEPETGSGIWPARNVSIFNNSIKIQTSPPTCEYGHEEYSTSAIRMADYRRKPGAPDGTFGNKVYSNKIEVIAREYPDAHKDYIPMAFAVFYSVSGGQDYVFGNDITVEKADPAGKAITTAFYICGGPESLGGSFDDNRIISNMPAFWVASMYGGAGNSTLSNNTIIKSSTATADFKPIRIGWSAREDCVAKNIQFRSNEIKGASFDLQITDQDHSYSVYWTLHLQVLDKKSKPRKDVVVRIADKNGNIVVSKKTDAEGKLSKELQEYSVDGSSKIFLSPYTLSAGKEKSQVQLNKNSWVTIELKD